MPPELIVAETHQQASFDNKQALSACLRPAPANMLKSPYFLSLWIMTDV
jgi:hypothetical protein